MMHTRLRVRLAAAIAVAVMLLTGCGFHGLYGMQLPGGADVGDHPLTLTLYFDNVLDLVPQSAVKLNDVPVGRVENISLSSPNDNSGDKATNGWTAKVTVTVNSDVKLPANARAMIKQTSLLGEKYVDLEQPLDAPSAAPLKSGDTIPITRTGSAPETEEVLGALSLLLNGGGLQQIKIITTELNKALDGNESSVRDLIGQLNTFVGTLDQQKNQIIDSLSKVNQLAVTLRQNEKTITNALATFPQALAVLRQNRSKLTQMLTSLANLGTVATHVINATQRNFVASLKDLAPAVEQLTAAGSNLVGALKIAGTFPFPLKKTLEAVHGDYANLAFYLNLNLSDELCGVNKQLCGVVKGVTPQSAGTRSLPSTMTGPTLVGAGG